ncbi:hypothetical protein GGS20DRAFT_372821 [Poronia punctata]|nr:hypothetical protein GGS20DRAFT_372821 [Poronia punctata]
MLFSFFVWAFSADYISGWMRCSVACNLTPQHRSQIPSSLHSLAFSDSHQGRLDPHHPDLTDHAPSPHVRSHAITVTRWRGPVRRTSHQSKPVISLLYMEA